jgi:enoyl-CoA hydratase/carnithine racemase
MALGGGFEVALAADLIIAGDTAKFGLPEVSLGLVPGWGGTQRLTAQVGSRKAKEIIMLGQRLPAAQAWELGLVNEVVPAGACRERALELAGQLAGSSASALAATKELVSGAERALAYSDERAALMELFTSVDGIEGVAAFVQKRPAQFGR